LKYNNHLFLTIATDGKSLCLKILRDIDGGRSGNGKPRIREEGTGDENEGNVSNSVDRVANDLFERARGAHVVDEPADWDVSAGRGDLPAAEEVRHEVGTHARPRHLTDHEHVGHQRALQDDWNVGGVEKLDGVSRVVHSFSHPGVLDWKVNSESLEVNNNTENDEGGEKICYVCKLNAVERLLEGGDLVRSSNEEGEKRDQCAFILRSRRGLDGSEGKRLPEDVFTDIARDEERNRASESVSFRQKVVQHEHHHSANEELENDKSCSSRFDWSTVITFAPASICIIIPEVTRGEIPSSINVPLLDASMTR